MKKLPTMIIDGNHWAARLTHTTRGLTSPDGKPSGALYAMIRSLRHFLAEEIRCWPIYFCMDAGIPKFRIKLTKQLGGPGYKSTRKKNRDEEFYQAYKYQVSRAPMILRTLGVHTARAQGMEADDVIAALCAKISKSKNRAIIYSSDKDLIQLANKRISVFRPIKKPEIVKECPEDFLLSRAIIGDKSDDIIGVSGIGEVFTERVLCEIEKRGKNLEEFFQALDFRDKKQRKVKESEERIRTNIRIMDLRRTRKMTLKRLKIEKGKFDLKKFRATCKKLAFAHILMEVDHYTNIFKELENGA